MIRSIHTIHITRTTLHIHVTQVLLGIAHGAWLVSSAWLDACVTSASWVEETPYLVDV